MAYTLRRLVSGTRSTLPIDQARFEAIKSARDASVAVLGVEEKFDLVLACYQEFEEALLSVSLSGMMYQHVDWSQSIDKIQLINRRLVALLSAGRLYEEQVEHDVRSVYGRKGEQTAALVARIERANKEDRPFRLVDALRNYMQHRNLPVHNLRTDSIWEGDLDESRRCVHSVDPQIDTDRFKGDRRFDESLLQGIPTSKGKANIRPLLQSYVATLGGFHQLVRELTDPDVQQWDNTLLSAENDFVTAYAEGSVGLAAVHQEDGELRDFVHVFTDPVRRRQMLSHKNRHLEHYTRHIVASVSRTDA